MKKVKTCSSLFAMLAVLAPMPSLSAATPLVEYLFNGSGTTAANSGSASNENLTMLDSSLDPTDLYGAAGSGVSGASGDLAFDNTASTGMGNEGIGGQARASATNLGTLASFTVMGWINTTATTGQDAAIFDNMNGSDSGLRLEYNSSGSMTLRVDGFNAYSSGSGPYSSDGEWVFFAMTYDGTDVRFYVGSTDESTSANATRTPSPEVGPIDMDAARLAIGNISGYDGRPFDGMIDNFRIFGSESDASGALTPSEIEGYRSADTAIPEPSESALVLGGALLMLALLIRRFTAK